MHTVVSSSPLPQEPTSLPDVQKPNKPRKRRFNFKPAFWALVFAALFVCLQGTPIRMGVNANHLIPVIGQVETLARNSCDRTLAKVSEAYGTANTLTKTISTAHRPSPTRKPVCGRGQRTNSPRLRKRSKPRST